MPFQCPTCFGLFRVRRDEASSIGNCPSCEARILIPSLQEIKESLLREKESQPEKKEPKKVLGSEPVEERVPVYAKAEIIQPKAESLEEDAAVERVRKKRFIGQNAGEIEWEEGDEVVSSGGVPWLLLGSVILFLVLVVGVGAHYVRGSAIAGGGGGEAALLVDSELTGDLALQFGGTDEKEDQAVQMAENAEKFDRESTWAAIEGFLTAETVEARAEFIRDPERVRPLMKIFYERNPYEPEGFRKVDESRISIGKTFMTSHVQTRDFLWAPIGVERVADSYVVDWESWVGYSEMSFEEMMKKRPRNPVLVRVTISPRTYYNYGFSDDKKWVSYRLAFPNDEGSLWAYVERSSELFSQLDAVYAGTEESFGVFKIKFPSKARIKDQVILTEMISSGWVTEKTEE